MKVTLGFLSLLLAVVAVPARPNNTVSLPSEGETIGSDIVVDHKLLSLMGESNKDKRGISMQHLKWSKVGDNVKIPYVIENIGSSVKSKLMDAFSVFKDVSCVEFVPRNNEKDYIAFADKGGCTSDIGRLGGKQEVSLSSGCNALSTVLHELMHALGFLHEHNRPDRDEYIQIKYENIEGTEAIQRAFAKRRFVENDGDAYDKQSLMHYNNMYFSFNGLPTMESRAVPKGALEVEILGGDKFSKTDLIRLNKFYNCAAKYQKWTDYKITIRTSDKWFAGTSENIYLELFGENGEHTGEWKADGSFQQDTVDISDKVGPKLDKIINVQCRNDNSAYGSAWHLDSVKVEDTETGNIYISKCGCWIYGDGDTKLLPANLVK